MVMSAVSYLLRLTMKSGIIFFSHGEVSSRRSVRAAKCPYGEVSLRRSVRTAKCPYGEVSYGEKSYGENSGNQYKQIMQFPKE